MSHDYEIVKKIKHYRIRKNKSFNILSSTTETNYKIYSDSITDSLWGTHYETIEEAELAIKQHLLKEMLNNE